MKPNYSTQEQTESIFLIFLSAPLLLECTLSVNSTGMLNSGDQKCFFRINQDKLVQERILEICPTLNLVCTITTSLPLIHSRRVVVSYKRKYVHELLVNRLFKPAQEKVWLGELTVPQ